MKKETILSVLAILLFVFGVGATVLFLVFRTPLDDAEMSEKVFQESKERLLANDKVPPEENGYPELESLLKLMGPKPPPAYSSLSDRWVGTTAVVLPQLEEEKDAVTEEMEAFQPQLETLRVIVGKPVIAWPPELDKGANAPGPNFLGLRALSKALATAAAYHQLAGRNDEAFELYLLGLELPARFTGRYELMVEMIAVAMEEIALDPLQEFLTEQPLSTEQYRRLMEALGRTSFGPDNLGLAMDNEYAWALVSMEQLGGGSQAGGPGVPGFLWGPYLTRNKNLYSNLHLKYRDRYYDLASPVDSAALGQEIEGQRLGDLVRILYPNAAKAHGLYALLRTRLLATQVLAAVLAYHSENGAYPESLEQLVPDFLEQVPGLPMGDFIYEPSGETFVLKVKSPRLKTVRLKSDEMSIYPWQNPRK